MSEPLPLCDLPVVVMPVLCIPASEHAAPLSEAQQAFNALSQRVAQQRQWLQAWEAAVQACRSRFARDGVPLRVQYVDLQAELVRYLDAQVARKLSKIERTRMHAYVLQAAQQVAELTDQPAQRVEMQAVVQRYTEAPDPPVPTAQPQADAPVPEAKATELDWDDPEAVAAYIEAQAQAAARQAAHARQAHQARRAQQKAQARAAAAPSPAQLAAQSLRDVYRRLASRLHPDRELDAAERARKTALMQRANLAYEGGRMLELLELQWEAEALDATRLAQLSDARLQHYSGMLQTQLQDLQRQADIAVQSFVQEFGVTTRARLQPAKLMGHVRERLQQLQDGVQGLQHFLRVLHEDPEALRQWLKQLSD